MVTHANVMPVIQTDALVRAGVRASGELCDNLSGTDVRSALRRKRSRRATDDTTGKITSRGLWRAGGMIGALVYCVAVWGALFEGVPRVVAWLGERTAMASQPAQPEPSATPPEKRVP